MSPRVGLLRKAQRAEDDPQRSSAVIEINSAPASSPRQSHQAVTAGNAGLSAREIEVLNLAHLTYREIGAELGIAAETVRCHMKYARLKLGAESARAAVAIWNSRRAA